jgi:multidrug efflux pump subunit AcrB
MNPIIFALRHPITVIVGIVAIVGGSVLAYMRMKKDIFPELNLPVIYVAQPYGGMDPAQMEGLLTNYYEYHFLYISGIHHVESKNIQGVAVMRLYFHPGTDMAQAMAETINYVNRSRAFMPPGTVAPFVMRFDTGSVPVGYLVLSTKNKNYTIGNLQRMALFDVRPIFANLEGVSAPPPFGGSQRTIVLKVDPTLMDAKNVSLQELITALNNGNTISPSGNMYLQDEMPIVRVNAVPTDPQELRNIPIRPGSTVFLRDIGEIKDATDIATGYALVNGQRTVYMLVTRRPDASTLSVVNAVKNNMQRMRNALPEDVDIDLVFDQSPYVTRAMWGVGVEGLLGAILTGLMVLVFLRDWRSVIVVVLNIPFALLGAVLALSLTGQTINIMTLGGLALAVGILVDESTVEVENIHTQMEHTDSMAWAVRLGNAETAVPRLLAMLCILAVFMPSFFMQGAARSLFVPLSLAVGFSMVTSYFLSSTFVPVMSVWLLRHHRKTEHTSPGFFDTLRLRYAEMLKKVLPHRWALVGGYLVGALALTGWWFLNHPSMGTEIFPNVDAGQFQLRLRAPTGTKFQRTEELTLQALEVIKETVGPDNVGMTVCYVGVPSPNYPINNVYLWTSGPEEAVLRVELKRGSGVRTEALKETLRTKLKEHLEDWLQKKWQEEEMSPGQISERIKGLRLSFEPADIVNEVMSFGSPSPIEVVVSGKELQQSRAHAEKIKAELDKILSLRDLQYGQPMDYPTVDIRVDREKLGVMGGMIRDVTDSVLPATSSSRYMVPMYWPDPKTGIGFQVQVEIPLEKMKSEKDVALLRLLNRAGLGPPLRVRDVGDVQRGTMPGEFDRYNMRRLVSLTANIQGEDLGHVSDQIAQAIDRAGEPPRGVEVDVRGQVVPMRDMFFGLAVGLALAVAVIFLLLTGYFQSVRLAFIVVMTAPAVILGVTAALVITRTTLNLQSFMGAIMAIGVSVANSILLVTFAEKYRRQGASLFEAAVDGAQHRLRPILMTSFAMIAGMVPMALALGEGGEQTAPLARAVIGGLFASTFATLLLLPSIFAIVQSRAGTGSVSLDPEDQASEYFSPRPAVLFAEGHTRSGAIQEVKHEK